MIIAFSKKIKIETVSISLLMGGQHGSWLLKCEELALSTANFSKYVEKVIEYATKREALRRLNEFKRKINTTEIEDIVGEARKFYMQIQDYKPSVIVSIAKLVKQEMDTIKQKRENGTERILDANRWQIPMQPAGLNDIIGGFESADFILLGASNKTGKTKFLINQIRFLLESPTPVPVLFFSIEMRKDKAIRWLLSNYARIDSRDLQTGNLTEQEMTRLNDVAQKLQAKDGLLYIDDQADMPGRRIINRIEEFRMNIGPDSPGVVFLDYLQRVRLYTRKESKASAIEDFCIKLANTLKELGLAGLFLSQLAKAAFGRLATAADIKNSGGYTESATKIILLNNGEYLTPRQSHKSIFTTIQRDGSGGKYTCSHNLRWGRWDDDDILF